MAICDDCKQEMTTAAGCTLPVLVIDGEPSDRIRYGDERRPFSQPASPCRCHDCGVQPGALHHLGCDWEECPRCGAQLLSCCCLDDAYEAWDPDDEDDPEW